MMIRNPHKLFQQQQQDGDGDDDYKAASPLLTRARELKNTVGFAAIGWVDARWRRAGRVVKCVNLSEITFKIYRLSFTGTTRAAPGFSGSHFIIAPSSVVVGCGGGDQQAGRGISSLKCASKEGERFG